MTRAAVRCIQGERRAGERLTLLDCQIGRHTGHFQISRVRLDGAVKWGCDDCIAAAAEQTPSWLRERAA